MATLLFFETGSNGTSLIITSAELYQEIRLSRKIADSESCLFVLEKMLNELYERVHWLAAKTEGQANKVKTRILKIIDSYQLLIWSIVFKTKAIKVVFLN